MTQDNLELRLQVATRSLDSLQMIAKTLANLNLEGKHDICDSIGALVRTLLETDVGFFLLREGESLVVGASQGAGGDGMLVAPNSTGLWSWLLQDKVATLVSALEVERRWPDAPAAIRQGFAAAIVDIRDEAVGVIGVAKKSSGQPLFDEDVAFLSTAAAFSALAFANADAYAAQRQLARDLQAKAEEAQREAHEKALALDKLDEVVSRQQDAIADLSTPILELWDSVLALPIIGVVDSRRTYEMMEKLLNGIIAKQARFVVIDITGVEVVDTRTADHFVRLVKAAELLGAKCILTGIRPRVAQTLVDLGVDLSTITTLGTLQAGLKECLRLMNK